MGRLSLEKLIAQAYTAESHLTPEQRLLVGIFALALKDFLCPEVTLPKEHQRTAAYYFEVFREDDFGSFGHMCKVLDICPFRLRDLALRDSTVALMKELKMLGWNRRSQ